MCVRTAQDTTDLEHVQHHGSGERVCEVLVGEVESIHQAVDSPLVEQRRGLVVLERVLDHAVDHHLRREK